MLIVFGKYNIGSGELCFTEKLMISKFCFGKDEFSHV